MKNLDFIFNGVAHGSVANRLMKTGGDVSVLRPWIGADGRTYVTVMAGNEKKSVAIQNATATLRKDEWIHLDNAVIRAAQPQLKLVRDLRGSGLSFTVPGGMGKTILQHQTQSDISDATISMDGLRRGERDRPVYDLTNLPLPIIHKDFSFSLREILTSRQGGSPLDTSMAELAAEKVAQTIEKLATGTYGTYAYGGGTIYGLLNSPKRITHTITLPTATGWTPATTVNDVLDMIQKSRVKLHNGPWKLYFSAGWQPYLDQDYSSNYAGQTLRTRLRMIDGIQEVGILDFLETSPAAGASYVVMLVQQSSTVIREVVGMEMMTLQWETEGGLEIHYKVMAIMVPQIRSDQLGNTGLVHGSG